jgi:hypothetical protein
MIVGTQCENVTDQVEQQVRCVHSGWRRPQSIEHLLELNPRVATERVLFQSERLGLLLKIVESLGQFAVAGCQLPQLNEGPDRAETFFRKANTAQKSLAGAPWRQ